MASISISVGRTFAITQPVVNATERSEPTRPIPAHVLFYPQRRGQQYSHWHPWDSGFHPAAYRQEQENSKNGAFPAIAERILTGDEPKGISLAKLRTNLPVLRKEQAWGQRQP
jgi:hypothetical protein